jgi:hypothetical protein
VLGSALGKPTLFKAARGRLRLGLVLLASAGCGPVKPALPTARLEGMVSYRGLPVEEGGITFGPQDAGHGKSIWAPLTGGRYAAPAVPLGKVLVQINAVENQGTTTGEFGAVEAKRVNVVSAKYRSGVMLDVTGDRTDLNFELSEN